jgi:flagellar biosynthetic protein FliR
MSWLAQLDAGKFVLFTLILSRVGGVIATAPIFASPTAPLQFRALLTVAISLLILPGQWATKLAYPGSVFQYLIFAGGEVLIGFCLGMGVDIIFSGIQVMGQMAGRLSGEMMAEMYDPSQDEQTPVLANLLNLLTLAVFVALGGHRIVMGGLLETFTALPPGSAGMVSQSLVDTLILLVTQSFVLGIRAAAPLTVSLLLATLVIGLIGRTLPQLNVMTWGFGLTSVVLYVMLMLSLGGAVWVFQDQVEPALESLLQALAMPGVT